MHKFRDDYKTRPRSVLFNIEPMGLDGPRIEGLNSYLIRLAGEHSVNVRDLIRSVLVAKDPILMATQKPGFNHQAASTINGLGPYARSFASVLSDLTGRDGLDQLTLLPFESLFTPNGPGVLTNVRKWCPQCLVGAGLAGQVVYQPLAWSFVLYETCTLHHTPLASRCPHCQRRQPFIPRLPTVYHCAFCLKPLCTSTQTESEASVQHQHRSPSDQHWFSRAIENLIDAGTKLRHTSLRETFTDYLRSVIKRVGEGNMIGFYRRTGLPKDMCKHWLRDHEKPTLPQFLRLCRAVNMQPREMLGAGPADPSPSHIESVKTSRDPIIVAPIPRAAKLAFDENTRALMRAEITQLLIAEPPPMVSVVAKKLNTTTSTIRYWQPTEYQQLCARSRKHRTQLHDEMRKRKQDGITQAINALNIEGVVPSKHRIEESLKAKNLTMRGVDFKRHFIVINVPKTAIRNNVHTAKSTVHTKPFLKKLKPSTDGN